MIILQTVIHSDMPVTWIFWPGHVAMTSGFLIYPISFERRINSHRFSHKHTHTRTHTYTHTHTHTLSLSLSHTHTRVRAFTHLHSRTSPLLHTLTYTHAHMAHSHTHMFVVQRLSLLEMDTATRVQIPDEVIYISHCAMNPTILPPSMSE